MVELREKAALVTGGSSGIGLSIALALAREGCRVAICARGPERLQKAVAQFEGSAVLARACDVADREDVKRLVIWAQEELGPLEIVVNAAGINIVNRKMCQLEPADFDRIMAINCTGFFNVLHAVLPGMRQRQDGLIVNISSTAGKRAYELSGPAYSASKFAVGALATAVGQEERPNGIRITSICPGEVNTPILDQRPTPVPEERKAQMVQPEDIAACVVTIAKLPPAVVVPELIIKPRYQEYS